MGHGLRSPVKRSVALLDANVLYAAPVRDIFLQLTVNGLFQARWTEDIHREWISALLRERPGFDRARLERTRMLMNRATPDCLIVGYEALASTLRLPDPNDRHVLAAAIVGGCDMIVTANLADFPGKIVARHGIVTSSPDDFLVRRLVSASAEFCEAAKTIRRRLKSPSLTVDRYLANPGRSGSVETASALRRFAARL